MVNLAKKFKNPLSAEKYFQDRSACDESVSMYASCTSTSEQDPSASHGSSTQGQIVSMSSQVEGLSAEDTYSHCAATLQSLLPPQQ